MNDRGRIKIYVDKYQVGVLRERIWPWKIKGLKYIGSEMMMRLLGIQDQSLGERMVEAVNNLRTLDFTPVNHKSSNLTILYQFEKHSSRLFLARIQETY